MISGRLEAPAGSLVRRLLRPAGAPSVAREYRTALLRASPRACPWPPGRTERPRSGSRPVPGKRGAVEHGQDGPVPFGQPVRHRHHEHVAGPRPKRRSTHENIPKEPSAAIEDAIVRLRKQLGEGDPPGRHHGRHHPRQHGRQAMTAREWSDLEEPQPTGRVGPRPRPDRAESRRLPAIATMVAARPTPPAQSMAKRIPVDCANTPPMAAPAAAPN
jgi:hypothetical protein